MNRPSRTYKIVLASIMLVLLFSVFHSQNYLNHQRQILGLTRIEPLENAPPILEFTTKALGGFRGLIANGLWMRANDLQEDGKYFEAVQLADWITKLEPHLAQVWAHLAWNMAYNISIKFNEPEDRWLWVYRGVELLRDQGLKYNPREPLIYRELGWIYQHKMGAYMDDAHQYFKYMWAQKMSEVIGKSGRPNFEELNHPTSADAKERSRILREVYKVDPAFMKTVDEQFGPLEWRLPESTAIYWAVKGLKECDRETLKQEDFVTLRRVIFQSLQLAFMRGRLVDPSKTGNEFLYLPNLDIVKQTSEAYLEMANLETDKHANILNAHKNFLSTAIYYLYLYNRKDAAKQWYDYWKKLYPDGTPPMSLDDYVFSRVGEDAGSTDPVRDRALIAGQLETADFHYAIGEDDAADSAMSWAKRLHARYTEALGTTGKIQERMGLPPLPQLQQETLKRLLGPDSYLNPVLQAQLRTRLDIPADFDVTPATNQPPSISPLRPTGK